MHIKNKKIGIWGLGAVGTSAIKFFAHQTPYLQVMDQQTPNKQQESVLAQHHASFVDQTRCEEFLAYNDLILPSPGIDLRPYQQYTHKYITELDLFADHFKKPTIAITGSIGKTSVTYLLAQVLNKKSPIALGGNIGTPMLDLLPTQQAVSHAVLEVSSFQLEKTQFFAPDLAILTSFVPNHVDRHGTLEHYFLAKYKIMQHQNANHQALAPLELASTIMTYQPKSSLAFFSPKKPEPAAYANILSPTLFYCHQGSIMHYNNGVETPLLSVEELPQCNFAQNWLIVVAALKLLGIPLSFLKTIDASIAQTETLAHRLELCGTKHGIDFYNDSKATVMEATLAAIKALEKKPIILLLGGLSKGVNRKSYCEQLKSIKMVICFGAEANQLNSFVQEHTIESATAKTLEQAFEIAIKNAMRGDQILLSPGGSSYDLFAHYQERGNRFKGLVAKMQ